MHNKFTTSINIVRDAHREVEYLPTPNAARIIKQIVNDYEVGIRTFSLIGSYGTGKSAFLWALRQNLLGKKTYFNTKFFDGKTVKFLNLIGEYSSFEKIFGESVGISRSNRTFDDVSTALFDLYHDISKKGQLLVIAVDEFGKFLEYAAQNNPEKELYFMQQLSEFINNQDLNILWITTIHQNIDAYGYGLTLSQRQEWTKIKGRFRELVFNEPIEQLLHLASQHFDNRKVGNSVNKNNSEVRNLIVKTKALSLKGEKYNAISDALFPLDLLTANALALSLQKYGQNERSLFSFLESTDDTGLRGYDKVTNPFFNLACLYDYILSNFYSFIHSKYNPDLSAWSSIKGSIHNVERSFTADVDDALKIVKAIGLLCLTVPLGSCLDHKFLVEYSKLCLGIRNPEPIIKQLEANKTIAYRNYNLRYILLEGTDLDIQLALNSAADKISDISDISSALNEHYNLPPVIAKAYTYEHGTPRLFEYKITDAPLDITPEGEIDGFINLIFNDSLTIEEVTEISQHQEEAILYGLYRNSKTIREILTEIQKTKKVREDNLDDRVAIRELDNVLLHQKNLLTHKILNNFYSSTGELVWIYRGVECKITDKKDLNKKLSQICEEIYQQTPNFKNELVNKHKISASIHSAKRNYLKALCNNWNEPDLGFPKDKYPPEKTIYLSLLKTNGIELDKKSTIDISTLKRTSSFRFLWRTSEEFLTSAKFGRRSLASFISILSKRPLKLKGGFINFWLPTFLFIKRDEYALFGENGYIPHINDEVLELLVKYPEKYEIKTFDVAGIKLDVFNSYRSFLNQDTKEKVNSQTFIETIRPFLSFYKTLPDYSKNTKRLTKHAIAIRTAIVNSKDPEQSFFEDFPLALGFSIEDLVRSKDNLSKYIPKLQDAIREIRSSYNDLIERFEAFIQSDLIGEKMEFEGYKGRLQLRFNKLKRHLLLQNQKAFIARLDSKIEDRNSWLSSLAQVLVGKTLEQLSDENEPVLYEKFRSIISDLDSLTTLSQADIDDFNEEAIAVEIGTFVDGVNKLIVRLPKTKKKQMEEIEKDVRKKLSSDRSLNISVLANVLRDLIRK